MTYSSATILIMELVFFGSIIIGSYLIARTYVKEIEQGGLVKLIGYSLLAAFRFNFNTTPIPIGILVSYFIFKKAKKNKVAKKHAIMLGAILFVLWLYPFQNDIERLLYPRNEIKTYLSEERKPGKDGFIFTFSDKKSDTIYRSYIEKDERGDRLYRSLIQSEDIDQGPDFNEWKYRLYLGQDTESDRFKTLTFDITEDGSLILLTFEGQSYYFRGKEEFQSVVSEISEEIKNQNNEI